MKTRFALLITLGMTTAIPALAQTRTVEGVDWEAVPWATLCPNVEPVELRTDAGSCPTVHPASYRHAKWEGFGMDVKEPKPNCQKLEQEYQKFISPKLISGKQSDNPSVTWGYCMSAFARALEQRASEPERFSEPFEQWRERFFSGYITGARR